MCKRIEALEKLRKKPKTKKELLFVSFQNDNLYINDLKIIDKKAKLQIAILKILMEKHIVGSLRGSSTGLNTIQIVESLKKEKLQEKNGTYIDMLFDAEDQVKRHIYRIKKSIAAKLGKHIGENFIQSAKVAKKYKLNENVVLVCTQKMLQET
ncbi:MAG: hypothetical protein IJ730_04200 [Alphaproteobacteria bacterium]|nr:hypothetical protein [Alphaproteobacteria bacterium]